MNSDEDKISEWKSQVEECKAGGLAVREWCEENGINLKTYYYRQKKVRENESIQKIVPISSLHRSEICIKK